VRAGVAGALSPWRRASGRRLPSRSSPVWGGGGGQGGGGKGGKDVLKKSKAPADLERSILLEWREGSPPLQQAWSDGSAPVSSWEGITVGAEGRVVEIELSSEDLASVPAELGGLTELTLLRLNGYRLTSVPGELGNLVALKELDLQMNQLHQLPAEIGKLASLQVL
jgi:Leucine-rich repeat (LRR) protein